MGDWDYEPCPACNGQGRSRSGDAFSPAWPCGFAGCHQRDGVFQVPMRVSPAAARAATPAPRPKGPPRRTAGAALVDLGLGTRTGRRILGFIAVSSIVFVFCASQLSTGDNPAYNWALFIASGAIALPRLPHRRRPMFIGVGLGMLSVGLFSIWVLMYGPPRWLVNAGAPAERLR